MISAAVLVVAAAAGLWFFVCRRPERPPPRPEHPHRASLDVPSPEDAYLFQTCEFRFGSFAPCHRDHVMAGIHEM